MAHYAFINDENIVVNVITGVDEDAVQTDLDGTEVGGSEYAWETFYASLPQFTGLTCLRTSYNTRNGVHIEGGTPYRGTFAGIGFKYDRDFNIFIPPQPYTSWKFNYTICNWEPPVPMPNPTEINNWKWSEINKEWIQVAI